MNYIMLVIFTLNTLTINHTLAYSHLTYLYRMISFNYYANISLAINGALHFSSTLRFLFKLTLLFSTLIYSSKVLVMLVLASLFTNIVIEIGREDV